MNTVELENIKFSYQNNVDVLNIESLEIVKGERVFIHGPSGSGKSTLLNLLAGVLTPSSGSLKVLDKKLNDLSVSERDKFRGDHIGFVFQSFNLIPYLTIKENISLPYRVSKIKRNKISDIEEETLKIAKHLKIDNFLDQKVSRLSIGQQQRVGVARALIGNPDIVIADEPTSSLDDEVTDSFMNLLLEKQKESGFTLIFVSHDKRLEKHFSKVISLSEINKAGGKL
ncbi:MAG: ABC transporter ATP-binding protein [Oligoflexia bacterium]|nr:ABC transporter ATP-binding protein [Oligoflexia bacterium]